MSDIAILSLGAGVQSTALLLMACAGGIDPMPVEAIFADTGAEPAAVYAHLDWLESVSTIPITRVSLGNLETDTLAGKDGFAAIPLYVRDERGNKSMLRRQCTYQYKVRPIRRRIHEVLKEHGGRRAILFHGISKDEDLRQRDSDVQYIVNRYPLVERLMRRTDCLAWLAQRGYPTPPKSACYFCPFMDNARWRDMANNQPDEFAKAVVLDEHIRSLSRITGEAFLHRKAIPLRLINMTEPERAEQLELFDDECFGMCGV